jgi:hypothetical protein
LPESGPDTNAQRQSVLRPNDLLVIAVRDQIIRPPKPSFEGLDKGFLAHEVVAETYAQSID